jgi:hypothetical protein
MDSRGRERVQRSQPRLSPRCGRGLWAIAAAVSIATLSFSLPLHAEPSVEDVKAAGEQFNLGRTAFKEEEFAVAAEHFERADGLAPNPKVLLLAIQARVQAGQHDRAGMLAEVANRKYPGDERFAENESIIRRAERDYARVDVSCDKPCNLVVGIRLVHGEAATGWVLFLEDGEHSIRAGFGDNDQTKEYTARAGEVGVLEFEAPIAEPPAAAPADTEPAPGYEPDTQTFGEPPSDDVPPPPPAGSKGLPPTWFWVGAGTTVALAGVSTWSAIDTVSNPGQDAVRTGCAGQGESCALYQDGLERQSRTNLLWGITGGVGIATVVLFTLTDWGPGDSKDDDYSDRLSFAPWLDTTGGIVGAGSVGASARGTF